MISQSREVLESPIAQGKGEAVTYTLITTPWGTTPDNVIVTVRDQSADYLNVSSTVLAEDDPGVTGDVITLPQLSSLTCGHLYRIDVKFDIGDSTFETYFYVNAER